MTEHQEHQEHWHRDEGGHHHQHQHQHHQHRQDYPHHQQHQQQDTRTATSQLLDAIRSFMHPLDPTYPLPRLLLSLTGLLFAPDTSPTEWFAFSPTADPARLREAALTRWWRQHGWGGVDGFFRSPEAQVAEEVLRWLVGLTAPGEGPEEEGEVMLPASWLDAAVGQVLELARCRDESRIQELLERGFWILSGGGRQSQRTEDSRTERVQVDNDDVYADRSDTRTQGEGKASQQAEGKEEEAKQQQRPPRA
ncbi:hypothetical protein HDU96_003799 [Phlyctochytrium bullatum]|nr:hypothetical protein HDU96_003799 [Phlyctochytrium bullatum]